MFCYDGFRQHFTILRLYFNIWQLSAKGDQIIWAWTIMVCFLWMKPKLVWTHLLTVTQGPQSHVLVLNISLSFFHSVLIFLLKEQVFILPGLTTKVIYSNESQSILSWKGPTNFKVRPKEVSFFICLFLLLGECSHSLCQALGLSWPSAEPSQFSDLTESCPKHLLLGYQLLCLATSFKVSVSVPSAQPASSNSSQICSRESLLLWLWLPGCSFDASAKTEAIPPPSGSQPLLLPCRADTTLCAATEQTGAGVGSAGLGSAGLGSAGMHPTATLGCWQGQGTARMEQLGDKAGLRQLKVALLGVQPQPTVLLPQTIQAFSLAAGSEGMESSPNLSCEHCPPSWPSAKAPEGELWTPLNATAPQSTEWPVGQCIWSHLFTLKHPLKTPLSWSRHTASLFPFQACTVFSVLPASTTN